MRINSLIVIAAFAALGSASSLASALGPLPASATFANTVNGPFEDSWTFSLGAPSVVATSLTNVELTFGLLKYGGIQGFAAFLDGVQVFGPTSAISVTGPVSYTVTTQVLAGSNSLAAGNYSLVVKGTGVTGDWASYAANIIATPVFNASPVPEPESVAMLLGGLVLLALHGRRRVSPTRT